MKHMLLVYANESKVPSTPEEQQAVAPVRAALAEADLDEALRWAGKLPPAEYGSVEVRLLWSQQ